MRDRREGGLIGSFAHCTLILGRRRRIDRLSAVSSSRPRLVVVAVGSLASSALPRIGGRVHRDGHLGLVDVLRPSPSAPDDDERQWAKGVGDHQIRRRTWYAPSWLVKLVLGLTQKRRAWT